MTTLIMSLRRLYIANKITLDDIQERLDTGKITQEEYDYIVAEV